MSLRRTPPNTPNTLNAGNKSSLPLIAAPRSNVQSQAYDSDTPSERSEYGNVGVRTKRRRGDDNDISELRQQIMDQFINLSDKLENRFSEIKRQNDFNNNELITSIQVLSDKYDKTLEELKTLREEKEEDKKYIHLLEYKLEACERKLKSSGLEIRNVTSSNIDKGHETKEFLANIVKNLATTVNVDLQDSEIKDVYRINNKNSTKTIVVDFCSVIKRDKILQAVKQFNKCREKGDKLHMGHLKITEPAIPVYVSETLTNKAQGLYFKARHFARENGYAFYWTTNGRVYLRKAEGMPIIRIESETDIEKLTQQKQ